MFQKRLMKAWREATRHLENVRVVELEWEEFPPWADDELDWLYLDIVEALEEALKDGVRYLVFAHGPDRRPDIAVTTLSATRLWIMDAPCTRPFLKRWGCRLFDEAVLAEIRPPRTRDARARYFQLAKERVASARKPVRDSNPIAPIRTPH